MAVNRSDDSRYESRFGGGFVSSGQFIAELMCERLGKKDGRDLPVKFWNLPTWKKQFLLQVMGANSLLKLYSPKAIITAITKDRKAYSLKAPWLVDAIQQEQDRLDAIQIKLIVAEKPVEIITVQTEKPREAFSAKKSSLKKLRELDE